MTDYSIEKICEKLRFVEFVYFKKLRHLAVDSIKIKKYAIGQLQSIRSSDNNYSKTSAETSMLNVSATQPLKHACTILSYFLN